MLLILTVLISLVSFQSIGALEVISSGRLPFPVKHTSAIVNGVDSILVFSGDIIAHEEVFRFNVSTNLVEEFARFPVPMMDGYGGTDGRGEFYYVSGTGAPDGEYISGIWSLSAQNPDPVLRLELSQGGRIYHSAIASDGSGAIYFVRGIYGELQNIYKYNTEENQVETAASLADISAGAAGAWAADSFWLFGGVAEDGGSYTRNAVQFHPSTGVVEQHLDVLPIGQIYSTAVTVGDYIYLIGGLTWNQGEHQLTRFNTRTHQSETLQVENFPIQFYLAATAYDANTNRIYIFGGAANFVELSEIFYIQLDS